MCCVSSLSLSRCLIAGVVYSPTKVEFMRAIQDLVDGVQEVVTKTALRLAYTHGEPAGLACMTTLSTGGEGGGRGAHSRVESGGPAGAVRLCVAHSLSGVVGSASTRGVRADTRTVFRKPPLPPRRVVI